MDVKQDHPYAEAPAFLTNNNVGVTMILVVE
jgi:hypothetical protein